MDLMAHGTAHVRTAAPTEDDTSSGGTSPSCARRSASLWGPQAEAIAAALLDVASQTKPLSWSLPVEAEETVAALVEQRTVPMWTYRPVDFTRAKAAIAALWELLEGFEHPVANEIRRYVHQVDGAVQAAQALRAGKASTGVGDWSVEQFGVPDPTSVSKAGNLLTVTTPLTASPNISAKDLAAVMSRCIDEINLSWTVELGEAAAKAVAFPTEKRLIINKHSPFTHREARRLAVHEIAHLLRSASAERSREAFAFFPLGPKAMATEEGLAAWWEHELDVQDTQVTTTYAARTIAVDLALHQGITAVYAELAHHLPAQDAARVALRAKRGLAEPEMPGAFARDHIYLSGAEEVSRFLSTDTEIRATTLMTTKWALPTHALVPLLARRGLIDPLPLDYIRDALETVLDVVDASFAT